MDVFFFKQDISKGPNSIVGRSILRPFKRLWVKAGTEPEGEEKPLLINPSALYNESRRLIVPEGRGSPNEGRVVGGWGWVSAIGPPDPIAS